MLRTRPMAPSEALPAFVLALFDIAQFPPQLQGMIQAGYLATEFDDFLEANNGYWVNVDDGESFTERYEKNRGVTITRTRPGLKAPMQVPVSNSAAQTPPNVGLTPTDFSIEQYTFTPFELTDGIQIDLIGTDFAIVNRFEHDVTVNLKQGVQSVDLVARDTYTAGYAVGAARVTAIANAGTNVVVHLDDIRGFDQVVGQYNVLQPPSSGSPLPIIIYPAGNLAAGVAASVTGTVADNTNTSDYAFVGAGSPGTPAATRGNGISGEITIATLASNLTVGDIIYAGDGPKQLFGAGGHAHWTELEATDDANLTSKMLLAAKGYLRNNAVPFARNRNGETEGTFCLHTAENVMLSLYNDADFKQANQTLGQSKIYVDGKVSQYLGVTFLPNTNAPKIPLTGGGYAYLSILTGYGSIKDEWYEGIEYWANSEYNPARVDIRRGIAQILMPAYADLQGRRATLSWLTIRDMICPTDITRTSVVLTGSGSRRTRAVAIWTYGAY